MQKASKGIYIFSYYAYFYHPEQCLAHKSVTYMYVDQTVALINIVILLSESMLGKLLSNEFV